MASGLRFVVDIAIVAQAMPVPVLYVVPPTPPTPQGPPPQKDVVRTCHRCGREGHKIAACTLPNGGVCYNCLSTQHRADHCPWEKMCRRWRDTEKCGYTKCTFAHAWVMRCWDCGELGHVRENCTYKEVR